MNTAIDPKNPPAVHEWTGPTGVKFRDVREPSGTYYRDTTPRAVIDVLERARSEGMRLRLFFGDTETGRDWLSEHDVCGTIGRTWGPIKSPILLNSSRSMGGGIILTDCILRILYGRCELYRHPAYAAPDIHVRPIGAPSVIDGDLRAKGYTHACDVRQPDGTFQPHANFKSEAKARRWVEFMRGNRLSK